MKDKVVLDIGRIMDDIFAAAQDFKNAFEDDMSKSFNFKGHNWDENIDFYPTYSFPPCNVYLTEEKTLVLEFALAGFAEKDISLEFKGDYLYFSAKIDEQLTPPENVRFFKRRLKIKDIAEQQYYVPADKFDRSNTKATYNNGILRLSIPPVEQREEPEGIKVEINMGE